MTLAQVKPEPVSWLWQDRIPHGAISIRAGDPGGRIETATLSPGSTTSRIIETGTPNHHGRDPFEERRSRGSKLEHAKQFLLDELADEPRAVAELVRLGQERGVSEQMLERARQALGVKTEKAAFDRGWQWQLPEQPAGEQLAA